MAHQHIDPVTLERARTLRAGMTPAERRLWYALRRDALGVRFRRQHPIGRYIVDFACFPRLLAVEVDGWTHASAEEIAWDTRRSAFLSRHGWRLLRVTNSDVMKNLEGVVRAVHDAL